MRTHQLPDMLPGETNAGWCKRAAESIPAEELMKQVIVYFDRRGKRSHLPTWSHIGVITGHGSGVSGAIVDRFHEQPTGDSQ